MTTITSTPPPLDYSLVGKESTRAIERGLAEADWYTSPVPREVMRELLVRKDGPAIRDTAIWFGLLFVFGGLGMALWPSPLALLPLFVYGIVYASSSDSRWHECGHGTAFKTDWLNSAVYEIASFMVMRESTVWRWSHVRHHSDTIIVGRDPEIAVPRPPSIRKMITNCFNIDVIPGYFRGLVRHLLGRMSPEEKTFVPEDEYGRVFFKARIYLAIYIGVVVLAIATRSLLPLMLIGLPSLYGAWMMPMWGYTQHAGLAENVLDHRLNCRTVYMNWINRYLYWNMNFHLEHHMFPLVPYHALPKLHEIIKGDCPPPYKSIIDAYREIIPAVIKQRTDPAYCVKRPLPKPAPKPATSGQTVVSSAQPVDGKWAEVCEAERVKRDDTLRFDHMGKSYALYRTADDRYYATDGFCTHGNTHLADGLVKGNQIECPKHNGRFDFRDGSPARMPVCVALKTYDVRNADGKLWVDVTSAGGKGAVAEKTYQFRVVRNDNVATFIKELVLEPVGSLDGFRFTPGNYMQLDIPAYERVAFNTMSVSEPYAAAWKAQHVFDYASTNAAPTRRNYSLANDPMRDKQFRFNVRIATPPRGIDCAPGVGSSYVFNLKPGDIVSAIGPFGDFHIKPTQREMVYLGGGAGMAPMRSHIQHLFETMHSSRRVSFWYGARSRQELFYDDYFEGLEKQHNNFHFHVALSEPQPDDAWTSHTGFIHEVLLREYLAKHADPTAIEYYLCGPPLMLQAAIRMLRDLGVKPDQIAFDEF